jgi:hypothetical protein
MAGRKKAAEQNVEEAEKVVSSEKEKTEAPLQEAPAGDADAKTGQENENSNDSPDDGLNILEEIDDSISKPQVPRLICAVKGKQFIEKRIVIRSDEPVEVPLPHSSDLQSRIRVGYIKEVN